MRIIHFGHSCVLLETDSARLLIDPGTFAHGFETARELDGVLITHQHPDHLDPTKLATLLLDTPNAALVVDEGSAAVTHDLGLAATVLAPGEHTEIAGAAIHVAGGRHRRAVLQVHVEDHDARAEPVNVDGVLGHGLRTPQVRGTGGSPHRPGR